MASLLIMNNLLRYLLIIGKPATTVEVRPGSGTGLLRYWKCPVSSPFVNLHIKIFLDHRQTSHNGRGQVGLRTWFILLALTFSTKFFQHLIPSHRFAPHFKKLFCKISRPGIIYSCLKPPPLSLFLRLLIWRRRCWGRAEGNHADIFICRDVFIYIVLRMINGDQFLKK